jgi:hypothetical protein
MYGLLCQSSYIRGEVVTTTSGSEFKLTANLINTVCRLIRKGAPLRVAAIATGVSARTLQRYALRGAAVSNDTFDGQYEDTENKPSYLEFHDRTMKAHGEIVAEAAEVWYMLNTTHSVKRVVKYKYVRSSEGKVTKLKLGQVDTYIPPNAGNLGEWLSRSGGRDFRVTKFDEVKWESKYPQPSVEGDSIDIDRLLELAGVTGDDAREAKEKLLDEIEGREQKRIGGKGVERDDVIEIKRGKPGS